MMTSFRLHHAYLCDPVMRLHTLGVYKYCRSTVHKYIHQQT